MIFGLFRKKNTNRLIVNRQYAALTSTARIPFFYTEMNVPDTVMGRFEMLCAVMILFFRRTASCDAAGQQLAQEIIDAFFQDIDHSIRELGVGDQGVPKRMKKLAGMFYGRLETYAEALGASNSAALASALQRNIHPQQPAAPAMLSLAEWMMGAEQALKQVPDEAIARGDLALPEPAAGQAV